jgi:hypothetical protein
MAVNLIALELNLVKAAELAKEAAAKIDDGGTCNLDGVFLRIPRIREAKVLGAIQAAGLVAVKMEHPWYRTGYLIGTPNVGQANKRYKAARTMYDHMKECGWDVSFYCQAD